jgi:DNA-binding NarL/FixJ family response regulator
LIRVAVVAPGMALRIGLREVLRGLPNVDVVAEATSPHGLPPVDVLVLVSADDLAELDESAPPVLLLSNDPGEVTHLADFPVWGILPREAPRGTVRRRARWPRAVGRLAVVGANLLDRHPVPFGRRQVINPLTDRERQVLQLTAEGWPTSRLPPPSTSRTRSSSPLAYAKLGVTNRTGGGAASARRGWVVL